MDISDLTVMTDEVLVAAGYRRALEDRVGLFGRGFYELFGPDGELKQRGEFVNLITRVGDEYYGERAAGIAAPPDQVTGMQLGTGGATAAAKTGAGAAIVTLVPASLVAIDGGFPTSALVVASRRIQWKTTWGPGVATANGIDEAVVANQAVVTQTAVPEANTISRTVLAPVVNKGAGDTLAIVWDHLLLGA